MYATAHPIAFLDKEKAPQLPATHGQSDPTADQLFASLQAEAEEEQE